MKTYRVKDIFDTIQGEGFHAGTAAVFVRLAACNLWSGYDKDRQRDAERHNALCPLFCDTDFTKEGSHPLSASAIAAEARQITTPAVRHLVLTGGEPLLQLDQPLLDALHGEGFFVSVETNGTLPLPCLPDWITVSPKLPDAQTLIEVADEVKLVLPRYHPSHYPSLLRRVQASHLYVQPEDGPHFQDAVTLAHSIIRTDPRWKISTQTHKVLQMA